LSSNRFRNKEIILDTTYSRNDEFINIKSDDKDVSSSGENILFSKIQDYNKQKKTKKQQIMQV
jgi:hypothetical protein